MTLTGVLLKSAVNLSGERLAELEIALEKGKNR